MAAPKNPETWRIYALVDPRDNCVRYVGFTSRSLAWRLKHHLNDAQQGQKGYRNNWLRELRKEGLRPSIHLLDEGSGVGWAAIEIQWIALFKWHGARLTNISAGGDGGFGAVRSPETREKIRQALLGRQPSPLAAIRSTELNTGKPKPLEAIQKAALKNKGQKRSLESRKRMIAGRKRKISDETVRLIRANPDNLSQSALASLCGVTQSEVSQIRSRKTYKLVED